MTINYSNIRKQVTRQNAGKKPRLSKKVAGSFNFAAFMLPVLYNVVYKRYFVASFCLLLTFIPHIIDTHVSSENYITVVWIVGILTLIIALYSGMTGNKEAYKSRDYDDEEDFLMNQKGWSVCAVVALIIHLFIFPMQVNGHHNTSRMISLSFAKDELKKAILQSNEEHSVVGVNVFGDNIPGLFAEHINGSYDSESGTIKSDKGYNYKIEGYYQECGQRLLNTYHGDKTACAKVYVDVNGDNPPNLPASNENADGVKEVFKNSKKLNDIFVLYVYDDDLAPKEGSIEEYAFKKFERK